MDSRKLKYFFLRCSADQSNCSNHDRSNYKLMPLILLTYVSSPKCSFLGRRATLGKLIAFEGVGHVGKASLLKRVKQVLETASKVKIVSFPTKRSKISTVLRQFSEECPDQSLWDENKKAIAEMLFIADRFANEIELHRLQQENDFILLNRYILSGLIYRRARNLNKFGALFEQIFEDTFKLIPDVTFIFYEESENNNCRYLKKGSDGVRTGVFGGSKYFIQKLLRKQFKFFVS